MDLTPEQRRAIAIDAERLQILACAGSGKTEVLARRAARLLAEGADSASIIAFTFTDKAASELRTRIDARAADADRRFAEVPPTAHGMFVGTMHAWALATLRQLGAPYETMDGLTPEQEWALALRVMDELGIDELYLAADHLSMNSSRAVDTFLRSVEVVHNERIGRDVLTQRSPALAATLARYEQLLRGAHVLPFRMMIGDVVDELAPDGRLAGRLRGHVAHVLVDEYQDLNAAQDSLVERLGALGATIAVVGDDDQAIYQWRGGDIALFTEFVDRHRGAVQTSLALNHRSRPEIVAFASELVEPLGGRVPKELRARRESTRRGAIEMLIAENPRSEAQAVAARVETLLEEGHRPGDVAVLYRSVRSSAQPLLDALRARRIPAVVAGRTSMLARPEMAIVARTFALWNGGSWTPKPNYHGEEVTSATLAADLRALTGVDERTAQERLAQLDALRASVVEDGVRDGVALFDQVLAGLGLPGSFEGEAERELGLGRMSELIAEFDHAHRRAIPARFYREDGGSRPVLGSRDGKHWLACLSAFLGHFAGRAAEDRADDTAEGHDAVQVMTVHQSKGLEFPIVFVPALVLGRFPSGLTGREQEWWLPTDLFDRSRYEGRDDDEARLLYVALTRARELLCLSYFEEESDDRPAYASTFLQEHLRDAFRLVAEWRGASVEPEQARAAAREPLDVDLGSLATFDACGLRYWLRQVCAFQPPLAPELGYGKLLRHTVAELGRGASASGAAPTEADAQETLSASFYLPFAPPPAAEQLHAAGRRHVGAYVREHGAELARTVESEARFEVAVDGARVHGSVDLVLQAPDGTDGAVELVDFMTAAGGASVEEQAERLRLLAGAAEQRGWRPERLVIQELGGDGTRHEVPVDPDARAAFAQRLGDTIERIRRGDYAPTSDPAECSACDYRRFCAHAR